MTNLHFLLRFSDHIEGMFNKIFLLKMVTYSVVICLQGYQLMIVSVNLEFFFINLFKLI